MFFISKVLLFLYIKIKQIEIMTTQKFTFDTVKELQEKQTELKNTYGEENLVFNYGTFEEFNYNLTVHIFN